MTSRWHVLLSLSLLTLSCRAPLPDLDDARRDLRGEELAFKGAQGFAANARGGRGGDVIRVTTLAASGPGSLAAALDARGPRIIVFEVGGVIELEENLVIREPFLTVAGQTAPEPGITLIGAGLVVQAPEVIVRHLRIRPGDREVGPDPRNRDAIAIIGEPSGELDVHHVIIDHCSLSWGVDETFSTWYPGVRDVTLSNSIISESLNDSLHHEGEHSKGLLIGDSTRRFSMIGNVLAHNDDRNPVLKGDASALMVNNLVHDPGRWPLTFFDRERRGPSLFTAVGNVFTRGPSTPREHATILLGESMRKGTRIYLEDIIGFDGATDDPWTLVDNRSRVDDARVDTPPVWLEGLAPMPAREVEEAVLSTAGARPGARDPIDARVIAQVRSRSGRVIDSQDEVGGFPTPQVTRTSWDIPEDPEELEAWLEARHVEVSTPR